MNKLITILALAVLMVGLVSADREIATDKVIHIDNFIAGNIVQASFSFDYLDIPENQGDSPLVIKINLSTLDFGDNCSIPNCSVLKGDFEMNGLIKKYYLPENPFWEPYRIIPISCYEQAPLEINHPQGPTTIYEIPDGIFYCYNSNYEDLNLKLDEHDEVDLYLKSHQALYPGNYLMTAKMFYVNDSSAPFIKILNKNYFETRYFRSGNSFTINATIEDNVAVKINGYGGIVLNNSIEEFRFNGQTDNGIYYFPWEIPTNMKEGNYEMQIFAEDDMGNRGFDNTTLRIDNTAPNITLVSPANSSIYNDAISVKLNVTDTKSGVDNSSVYYRISEMVNGNFCPSTGIILGNYSCYNSGWMMTELNISSGYYEDEFDATNVTSGSYYFEAKAEDILGNEGILE